MHINNYYIYMYTDMTERNIGVYLQNSHMQHSQLVIVVVPMIITHTSRRLTMPATPHVQETQSRYVEELLHYRSGLQSKVNAAAA